MMFKHERDNLKQKLTTLCWYLNYYSIAAKATLVLGTVLIVTAVLGVCND